MDIKDSSLKPVKRKRRDASLLAECLCKMQFQENSYNFVDRNGIKSIKRRLKKAESCSDTEEPKVKRCKMPEFFTPKSKPLQQNSGRNKLIPSVALLCKQHQAKNIETTLQPVQSRLNQNLNQDQSLETPQVALPSGVGASSPRQIVCPLSNEQKSSKESDQNESSNLKLDESSTVESSSVLLHQANQKRISVVRSLKTSSDKDADFSSSSPKQTKDRSLKVDKLQRKLPAKDSKPLVKNHLSQSQTLSSSKNLSESSDDDDSSKKLVTTSVATSKRKKKKQSRSNNNGWTWFGKPYTSFAYIESKQRYIRRTCYPAIRRIVTSSNDKSFVSVRDCVFVKAPDESLPYVAKVTALWEEEGSGKMMMSIIWFYRQNHLELEGTDFPVTASNELYSSIHQDNISVECIEDRCHVTSYRKYCRIKAWVRLEESFSFPDNQYKILQDRLRPPIVSYQPDYSDINDENVFFSCHFYDIKCKRVLKSLPPVVETAKKLSSVINNKKSHQRSTNSSSSQQAIISR